MTDADLVKAAQFEVDSRARQYPASVASRKLTAEEATNDFQAWHCIAEWLDNGRSPVGMVEGSTGRPDEADLPMVVVEWLLCEQAAERAVTTTRQAHQAAVAANEDAKADRLAARLESLRAIAGRVTQQRRMIESLNRALRERRDRQPQPAAPQQPDAEDFRRKHARKAA